MTLDLTFVPSRCLQVGTFLSPLLTCMFERDSHPWSTRPREWHPAILQCIFTMYATPGCRKRYQLNCSRRRPKPHPSPLLWIKRRRRIVWLARSFIFARYICKLSLRGKRKDIVNFSMPFTILAVKVTQRTCVGSGVPSLPLTCLHQANVVSQQSKAKQAKLS